MSRGFGLIKILPGLVLAAWAAPALAQTPDPAALKAWEAAVRDGEPQDKPADASKQQPLQGQASPIQDRGNLNNQQDPAPRPDNLVLDPKFKGFIPVPNTPVMIKFNAKPRVDITTDNRNTGNEDRFATAQIPVSTDPLHGGGRQFNINAKASQLSIDVQAPEVEGSPRFYYQNDFFGSGGGEFPFRVRQLYGKIYNVVVGMTYSVFEDPDVWPDTVDYEGPNSATFARRPLARLMVPLNKEWQLNFGVEQPESEIDDNGANGKGVNHSPDVGANARWEMQDVGHVQVAVILRQLGYKGPTGISDSTLGWGLNLSNVFSIGADNSLQAQLTFGKGIFRYVNDDFQPLDAAVATNGDLRALPYVGVMFGFTHKWNDEWRSTATYGYVAVDNDSNQLATAYHKTHYATANVVWQIKKRLSLGAEAMYGSKEDNVGHTGNAVRVQVGLLYSLFD